MTLQTFDPTGADGVAFTGQTNITAGSTGTAVYAAADAIPGSGIATGVRITPSASNARNNRATINSSKTQGWNAYFKVGAPPASGQIQYASLRTNSPAANVLVVERGSTGIISIYETGTATRTNIPSASIADNTYVRVQILVAVGSSTNDSNYTAKAYQGSLFTTQVGTTLTRSGIDLGTLAIDRGDVGMLTANATPYSMAWGRVQFDDGRTTDMPGLSALAGPTAVVGASDQYPDVGEEVTFNYTGTTAGSGSITAYNCVCTNYPGVSAPAITGATTSAPKFTAAVGSRYEFDFTVTQTGGLTNTAHYIVYPHNASLADVTVYEILDTGGWTLGGTGAASLLAALNSSSSANWAQSPDNPTSANKLKFRINPLGAGSLKGITSALWNTAALDLLCEMFMENGTTLLQSSTGDLTTVVADYETVLDSGDLSTAAEFSGRRGLVVALSAS